MNAHQTQWMMEGLVASGERLCNEWPQGVEFLLESLSQRGTSIISPSHRASLGRQLEVLNQAPTLGELVLLASIDASPKGRRLPRVLRRSPLGRAMAALGPEALKWVVAKGLLAPLLENAPPGHGQRIRRHCLGVAAEGEGLTGIPKEDQSLLFVSGLLHDAAQLLLLRHGQEAYGECLDVGLGAGGESLADLERQTLGFDHGALGEALSTRLALPQPVVSLLRDHHRLGERASTMAPGAHLRRLAFLDRAHRRRVQRPAHWAERSPYSKGIRTLCSAEPSRAL